MSLDQPSAIQSAAVGDRVIYFEGRHYRGHARVIDMLKNGFLVLQDMITDRVQTVKPEGVMSRSESLVGRWRQFRVIEDAASSSSSGARMRRIKAAKA